MPLTNGTKLGPYEIVGPLGAGGMGEVYRARDTRLERMVAIKILPAHLSCDPVRKQRFEREAKTISSLNHPHICVLHDVGSQDGVDYLVMECVEGETLAKRLEKGPLPLDQVLKYGAQIADALDKAHRSGVVHRDLKPGNVMLTPTGAKLLDFGLAKPAAPLTSAAMLTAVTQDSPVTEQGTIVGTFQYMSPEQVEGKELDGRSDIFSLGAVLYEMLTGQRAFEGKSQISVASAILDKEPAPITSVKPMTPPALDHTIRRSLAKDPEERWQTAGDVAGELKWVTEGGAQSGLEASFATKSRWRERASVALAASFAIALAGLAWYKSVKPRAVLSVVRFELAQPASEPVVVDRGPALAYSPDGRRLVSVVHKGETTQLYVRELSSFDGKALPGTEGAIRPFFSPDSMWLGFMADGKLKKISVDGGSTIVLCEAPESNGAVWLPDDTIVFNADWREGLRRVSVAGGKSEILTQPDPRRGEASHWWPDVLPGGKEILFTDSKGSGEVESSIAVVSLKTGQWKTVIEQGKFPRYLSSGHILFMLRGAILAAPFDTEKLAVTGPSFPVLEGVMIDLGSDIAQFAVSRDGSLAYVPGTKTGFRNTLVTVDRSGRETPLSELQRSYEDLALSPDGRLLALTLIGEQQWNVWVYDLSHKTLNRATFEGDNRDPIWAADSKHVIYASFRNGRSGIFWRPVTGPGSEEELVSTESQPFPFSVSPDGHWLSYMLGAPSPGAGVYLLPLEGERKPRPFVLEPAAMGGAISPDARWIAYESRESGQSEVYVRSLSGEAAKWQISTQGGIRPSWSASGHELLFRTGNLDSDSTLMSVAVTPGPEFSPSSPKPLFRFAYLQGGHDYAVMPDGQHFICIKESEHDTSVTQVNMVLNWAAELKKK